MRIGVDCHILGGKFQGSRTYLKNLCKSVLRKAQEDEFLFLADWAGARPFGPSACHVDTGSDRRLKRLTFGTQATVEREKLDAVHVGYVMPLRLKAASIVTLYDILFETHPEYFERRFVLRSKVLCRLSAHQASQIQTISEYSKRAIMSRYGIPEERLAVVPCGVDTNIYHPKDRQRARDEVKARLGLYDYMLTVGRLEPRKNHVGLIKAYARLKQRRHDLPRLAIVGQADFREEPVFEAISQLGLHDDVIVFQHVDDKLLPVVYRAAKLFVYPSFAEGFGLPPLEAMASGVPVVTSNTTAMPEVVGEDALKVDPSDVRQIADAIDSILSQPERAAALREQGRRRSLKWTWDDAADKYLRAIESLKHTNAKPVRRRQPSTSTTIAFCGTRGIPANYGGFETAVDQITRHFVREGYDCEVFCRRSSASADIGQHEGRKLAYVNGHSSQRLDTFVAAIQTGLHLLKNRRKYRHVFWFNNANLPGILLTALARIPMSVNTDGLEWRRAKWSLPFKLYYWMSSFLIARLCRTLVSDSRGIQDYYRRAFFKTTSFIPYGAPSQCVVSDRKAQSILERYGLEEGAYYLQITRIEPDNLPLRVAESFVKSIPSVLGFKMVIVGYKEGTPYAQKLIACDGRGGVSVREAIYDPEVLQVLRNNCFCYVHGNSVGGTNPALLEAMATTPRVIAIDCVFSREVLGECGTYFDPENITPAFDKALTLPDLSEAMRQRVNSKYRWDEVAQSYMNLAQGRPAEYRERPEVPQRRVEERTAEMVA